MWVVTSEVSQHVHVDRPEHGVSLDKVKILTVENRKFEGGIIHQSSKAEPQQGWQELPSSSSVSVDQPAVGQGLGAPPLSQDRC